MKRAEYTFDEWVEKVFAGRAPSFSWLREHALSPAKAEWLITYPTRLFEEPDFLIRAYTERQIRRGLWNLPNRWELATCIWDKKVKWSLRRACIRSMVPLFERLFSRRPLGDTCFMWWDLFRYFGSEPDGKVITEMYLALRQILLMQPEHCQIGALHGLGHLRHSRKRSLINDYLEGKPDIRSEVREYALACITGEIL